VSVDTRSTRASIGEPLGRERDDDDACACDEDVVVVVVAWRASLINKGRFYHLNPNLYNIIL